LGVTEKLQIEDEEGVKIDSDRKGRSDVPWP